jgi:uncharacterized Fe-S radical SAM superfamily protein PflX
MDLLRLEYITLWREIMLTQLVKIVSISALVAHNAVAYPVFTDSGTNNETMRLLNQFLDIYNNTYNNNNQQQYKSYSDPNTYPQHAFPDHSEYDADTEAFINRYRGQRGQVYLKNF